jgi:type II secretory pathway component PulK
MTRTNKGSIFITALWMLLILTALALGVARVTRVESKLTGFYEDGVRLTRIGLSAARATEELILLSTEAFRAPAQNQGPAVAAVEKKLNLAPGALTLRNENSKLNLNAASRGELERLFALAPDAAQAVIDWRDEDHDVLPQGAENEFYARRNLAYSCRNAPLESVEELMLIKGVTPELWNAVKDHVTVYGRGDVNINSAGAAVLDALGLDEAAVRAIEDYRDGGGLFPDTASIVSRLEKSAALSAESQTALAGLINKRKLSVATDEFELTVRATTEANRSARRLKMVLSPRQKTQSILLWREGI